jgi:hypothetical protein
MPDELSLLIAFLVSIAGMGWLALSIDVHWRQVHGDTRRTLATTPRLRALGTAGLIISLALCLAVNHASMASLLWVMTLTAAALIIAVVLTWRAQWLQWLAPT